MKIIDNRYKIENIIESSEYFQSYKVVDLWNGDKVELLKIYNSKMRKELISHYIDNFRYLSNIRHESLLSCYGFNIIKTIDAKKINMTLYYCVTEYNDSSELNNLIEELTLKERLNILLQVILVIDFLHFRGLKYKYLNQYNIFINDNKEIKITDLSNIYETKINNKYRKLSTYFISPKVGNDKTNHRQYDYYSIGVLMKYMLLEDFLVEEINFMKYNEKLGVIKDQEEEMNNIINKLVNGSENSHINLIEIIDKINNIFNLNYTYDLKKNRETLHFKSAIVGRQKEVNKIISIDKSLIHGTLNYKGILIKSDVGIGKTRFISEIAHQLKLRGRNIYSSDILGNENKDLLYMSNILKQSIKDTPRELMDKYKYELCKILPELRINSLDDIEQDLDQKTEIFRLYNRITNYFNDLSKNRIIYIIIDDLHYMSNDAIVLIDYIIKNIKSNNIFFIFSIKDDNGHTNTFLTEKVNSWNRDSLFIEMELYKLNLQEIEEMLKNILGIPDIPMQFSTILFKQGQGNPRYIEYIIKELFNMGELYMHEKGRWFLKAEDYSEIHFPIDMEDALRKQLDIIRENHFEIFKVMSIFNSVLNKNLLLDMSEKNSKDLEQTLDGLIKLGLIDEKISDWGYGYSIGGMDLKRLIYSEISQEEKINLHARASDIIENYINYDYSISMEELLFHLIKSKQYKRALNLIFKKTENIENKYSTNILFLWEKAYEIVKTNTSEIKLNILEKILEIYSIKEVSKKVNLYLEEYQKESKLLNSYRHIINGKYLVTENYFRLADPKKALDEAKSIEKISEQHNIVEGKIIALIIQARFGLRYGETRDFTPELKDALKLSDASNVQKYKGNIYNLLGLNEYLKGNTDKAIEKYKKSIYYNDKIGNLIESLNPINNIGTIYAYKYGNVKKAMEYYTKGLKVARQFGFQEMEMVFLNNISEIYIKDYEFNNAIEYIETARKIALELGNLHIIILSNINMGYIQIAKGNYEDLYITYNYLKEIHDSRSTLDIEVDTQYNNFLGSFYGLVGQYDKSIHHSKIASDLCEDFNIQEYLNAESRILYMKFLKNSDFSKNEINKIRKKYTKIKLIQDRRLAILAFAIISILKEDVNYAQELLDEDLELSKLFTNSLLEEMREMIFYSMDTIGDSIDKIIALESKMITKGLYDIGLGVNTIIGCQLLKNNLYEEAIKYFLESLDNIYKKVITIPNSEFKISYIESRKGDLIKEHLTLCFKKAFNKEISYTKLKDIDEKNLFHYFDISNIFEVIDNEDLSKITHLGKYRSVLEIKSIEGLISNLTADYKYNLELILGYIAKESLAKDGIILGYDEDLKQFIPIVSLGINSNYKINENILNLSSQDNKGILINTNVKDLYDQRHKNLLSEDTKAIICVPILRLEERIRSKDERRITSYKDEYIQGYIYLETDKVFNRFDSSILDKVVNLSYLIYINLENSKLQLISTTDKLTGTFTRKYYEGKIEQLLDDMKSLDKRFSVILLDIDDFKNINDSYGHRKGDEALKILGSTLKTSIRNSDIVARYGGEEFIILLKNTTEEESVFIAEKIRSRVKELKVVGIDYPITVSLGISLYPKHSQYKEELVEKADQALYYSKEMGKNRVAIWDDQMDSTLNRADKLAGILTGNMNDDNINILAMMDIIDLIKQDIKLEDKIFIYLGKVLETINGEFATVILEPKSKENRKVFTRTRFNDQWVSTPMLNHNIINRIIANRKGEYLIDWDDTENIDPLSGVPNWQSKIILPIIRSGELKCIVYISVSLQLKEFDFDSFNISKRIGNIFAGTL